MQSTYIREQFGAKRRIQFLGEVLKMERTIVRNPNIGPIDPLFSDRTITYRSVIINGLNKMVYYIDDNTIHIAAFWDTRREPRRQASQTE